MTDSPKKYLLGAAVLVVIFGALFMYFRPVGVCTRALWMQPDEVSFAYTASSLNGFDGVRHKTGVVYGNGFGWVKLWKGMREYDQLEDPSVLEETAHSSHGFNYTINIHCGEHSRKIKSGDGFHDPSANQMLSSLLAAAGD